MKKIDLLTRKSNRAVILSLIPLAAIFIALAVGALLIALAGINPMTAYRYLFHGAFGTTRSIGETLSRFVPLLFCGLSFSFAFKAGFFNIGSEGQFLVGGLGAVLVGVYLEGVPPLVHISLALGSGFLFGAALCAIAGLCKIFTGASELINTMMLNYIVFLTVDLLLKDAIKDPNTMMHQTKRVSESVRLPYILPGTRLHTGIFIAVLSMIVIYYVLNKTAQGFQLRTIGTNPHAAKYAGMNVMAGTWLAIIVSGGLAGLGGAVELIGTQHRLLDGFSGGYGFDAIGAAVMARHNPFGIAITALLFAVLRVGAGAMQRGIGVPLPLVWVIQGLLIILVISSNYITRKLSSKMIGGRA